jgi:hypothetical protein
MNFLKIIYSTIDLQALKGALSSKEAFENLSLFRQKLNAMLALLKTT